MSVDDDDEDIWGSDDFIATVEVFLQKAEHDSAVKHGTQSVVPPASSNFPGTSRSTYSNVPTTKFGRSSADPKRSSGLPSPGAGYSGRAMDFPHAGPKIRTNENVGRASILQPLNYQNPWTGADVRDAYASQQSKGLGHDNSGKLHLGIVENENPTLKDILAEKDGAISLLRIRLREAEQQVDEFRRRASSQTSLQPPISQQRELERLSSQLLFKEHEVSEVQRVRLEKEEQLKDALAEAASLRQELERLKQSRSTDADRSKRPRDEGASSQEKSVHAYASGSSAGMEKSTRNWEREHDPWRSPWLPENTTNGTPRKTSQREQEKSAKDLPKRLQASDASPAVATLKKRTAENGCVPSAKNDLVERENLKAVEISTRETAAQTKETETRAGMSELSYSLQQIWGFKGVKNDGKALVAKLYATCAQDLYVLLTNGENRKLVDSKMERRKSETLTLSEKFHGAIAKVTNGSAPPEIILGPLLEFCKMENTRLLGSALRVLHCILQHDENCRQRVVGRAKQSFDLPTKGNVEEGRCGFKIVSKILADGETKQVPVFSSPRIILCNKGGETSGTGVTREDHASDNFKKRGDPGIFVKSDQQGLDGIQKMEVDIGGKTSSVKGTSDIRDSAKVGVDPYSRNIRSAEEQQSPTHQQTDQDDGGRGTKTCHEEIDPFLKCMLHLALTSTSPLVRLEAVTLIGVLVVHSEPLIGRLKFGSLLNHEGFETLLKESAGVEIQLQAVRIVHHLLHCPRLYRNFCTIAEEETVVPNSKEELCDDRRMVVEESDAQEGSQYGNNVNDPVVARRCTSGPTPGTFKSRLLGGLTECLKFTGTSLQGYALRRSVMRLITFIASCGDAGVAFLTQPITTLKSGSNESTRTSKDDTKADGMHLGESASGQHIAGDGPSFKDLDARGRLISNADELEGVLPDNHEDHEDVMNIPERLVTLLGAELESKDEDQECEASVVEERACLIREVATLLSCLASHPVQSGLVLSFLISNPRIARLTLSVTNDLVSRKSLSHVSATSQKHASLLSSETAELCRSLRRRVLRAIASDP